MDTNKVGEELIKEGAPKVTEKDIVKVVNKSEEIQKKFRSHGPLQRFIDDGRLLIAVVKDYWSGTYRKLPYGTVAAIVFTLIYVFNPLDLVPDVLPHHRRGRRCRGRHSLPVPCRAGPAWRTNSGKAVGNTERDRSIMESVKSERLLRKQDLQ